MDLFGVAFLLGRFLFGGFWIYGGLMHLMARSQMISYAKMKGVPLPGLAVYLSGLMIIGGGLGIVLGVFVEWALLFVALFLIPVTLLMHDFWKDTDPQMRRMNQTMFMKNLALLGATFLLFAIATPWPYAFTLL